VEQRFGGGSIETEESDALAGVDDETLDAKRPQAAIVFDDAGKLDDRRHEPRCRIAWLTSSTIRLEAPSASTSIFAAARLQAIAP